MSALEQPAPVQAEPAQPAAAPAPPAEPAAEQTLHDFAFNLLTDENARNAFAADPTGCLAKAGLGDVTPQDVQEILPLVADFAPAESSAGFAAAGYFRSEHAGLTAFGSGSTEGVEGGVAAATGEFAAGGGVAANPEDGLTASSTVDSPFGGGYSEANVSKEGVSAGTHVGNEEFGVLTAKGHAGPDGLHGEVVFESDHLSGGASLSASKDGYELVAGAATPLGAYGVAVSGEGLSVPEITPIGNPADLLDATALSQGAEAASGAVAGYVTSGGDLVAGGIRSSTESLSLGGYLTGTGDMVADHVEHGANTVADQVANLPNSVPTDLPTDLPASLPAGLPTGLPTGLPGAAPQLPEMPGHGDLPIVSELPGLGELPVQLPDLPVANPLPDVASLPVDLGQLPAESPLGSLPLNNLTELTDLPNDLGLGH